jgi:outer membrane immunogenic protein
MLQEVLMRKILFSAPAVALLSLPAFAADLPSRKEAPAVLAQTPVYDWTGFYAGVQLGGLFGSGNYFVPQNGYSRNVTNNGVFGGGFVGYNYQINSLVLGLQGEFNGSGASGSNFDATNGGAVKAQQDWFGSIDGRIGYAFEQCLFYAIGGVGFSNVEHDYLNRRNVDFHFSNNRTGYDVGAGVEYAINRNWTARLEYRYYNFGNASYAAELGPYGGTLYGHNFSQADNTIRIGVSYRIGTSEAVVAKY